VALATAAARLYSALLAAVRARLPRDASAAPLYIPIGGVDSATLAAAVAHLKFSSPITLVNCSFGRDPDSKHDRISAKAAFAELQAIYPHAQFRLITRDVSDEEVLALQADPCFVANLKPAPRTVMHLNIGAALYFATRAACEDAARRSAVAAANGPHCSVQSAGHVEITVFSGLGPDETLSGYRRHANALRRETEASGPLAGWAAMVHEARLDIERLWIRNNGRDGRVMAAAGRQVLLVDGICASPEVVGDPAPPSASPSHGATSPQPVFVDVAVTVAVPYLDAEVVAVCDALAQVPYLAAFPDVSAGSAPAADLDIETLRDISQTAADAVHLPTRPDVEPEPVTLGDKYLLRVVSRALGLLTAPTLPKRAIQFGSNISAVRGKGRGKGTIAV
jgi:asparagine synthetase B (glutamine-hydrolysing)